jgi:hypothetical protein
MDVIEKAARALATLECATWDAQHFGETPCGQEPEDMRRGYRDQARAVLLAIREPSEGMKVHGSNYTSNDYEDAECCWQAMIDAALTE